MSLSQEERLYIEMLQKQVEAQARYIDEVREVKHDMYAHMMVLSHYMRAEEYEKARAYLSKVMNIPVFQHNTYVDIGNDMVNALLTGKIQESEFEIMVLTSGLLPEKMWIDDMDLCVLFSNLISNSVEACEKLTYKEKEIVLEIEETKKGLSLLIKNPVEKEPEGNQQGWSTTKADAHNHGYGLRNIKRIVEKYCGDMEMEYADGLVLVKIKFPHIAEDIAL